MHAVTAPKEPVPNPAAIRDMAPKTPLDTVDLKVINPGVTHQGVDAGQKRHLPPMVQIPSAEQESEQRAALKAQEDKAAAKLAAKKAIEDAKVAKALEAKHQQEVARDGAAEEALGHLPSTMARNAF